MAQIAAVVVGALILAGLLARLVLTPASGTLLVLASARQPDHVQAMSLAVHSAAGWGSLDSVPARTVPAAPNTVKLAELTISVGDYDSIRLGGQTYPAHLSVRKGLLSPLLVGVAGGRPMPSGIYAGSESVSLGLNELAGQLKAMPAFSLIDQFGRPFTNATITGHDIILAVFHTSCHETCPLYTGLFLQLRRMLPPSVLLVEATTSPEEDTPQVLRDYAGRVGASWTFVTADPATMAEFWRPFDVQLSSGDVHRSELALIDSHGFIRTYYLGTPDVGGSLPDALQAQLNTEGQQLVSSHGNGWGANQVVDTLRSVGGLAATSSSVEGQAPEFSLQTLDGRTVRLQDYRGRPVMINFWATYCVPCRVEMPMIERMAAAHPTVAVLLIDERDDAGAARHFVSDLHMRSTVLSDANGSAGDSYAITGLPTTLFIRSDGTVEGRYVGQTNEQIVGRHLAAIGGGKTA